MRRDPLGVCGTLTATFSSPATYRYVAPHAPLPSPHDAHQRARADQALSRGVVALDSLTVDIEPGIIGFVGANGAGRARSFASFSACSRRRAAASTVLGMDVTRRAWRSGRLVGYMPEHDCLPLDVSGTDFVDAHGANLGASLRRRARARRRDAASRRSATRSGIGSSAATRPA